MTSRYPSLPGSIRESLGNIVASGDNDLWYFPCRVTLSDGKVLDTVYIAPEMPYLKWWGVYPEDDRGKRFVKIEDVVKVEDSPTRLPAQFANQIYDHGESGMGYTIFTVVFSDGERQPCVTGNAVDFIQYPQGRGPNDVVAVLPHEGRESSPVGAPDWYWCLYSGEPFQPVRTAVQESGGLRTITETLTVENHAIRYCMDWRIFKRRLAERIRAGMARQIPSPPGIDGPGYEWYLDIATGELYRYRPPTPSVAARWMSVGPQEIDSEELARWERVPSEGLGLAIQ